MRLYILGNGGYANEVFDHIFLKETTYEFCGFITLIGDKAFVISTDGISAFEYDSDASFILGTRNLVWKSKLLEHFLKTYNPIKKHFPNIYSNRSSVSATSILGVGNLFLPFSSVHGIATIGNFNSFSSYSSVHTSCKIGNYNTLHPYAGIMNRCCIGDANILQPNSIITEKITIGNNNIISAGECVFDNVNNDELFQSGIIHKKGL
jgi:acetyltransferase-like isoleucine patch superfamily enzyme